MKKKYFLLLLITLFASKIVSAQAVYIGEIKLFAGNFAPVGWAFCNGQLISVAQNDALFSLLGTTYGGDGRTTFALPDLRSRVPIGTGERPGGSTYVLGQIGGSENITLISSNLPSHSHISQLQVSDQKATLAEPTATSSIATAGNVSGRKVQSHLNYISGAPDVTLQTVTTSSVGVDSPTSINIVKPSLGLNYIISLYGIFPSPN